MAKRCRVERTTSSQTTTSSKPTTSFEPLSSDDEEDDLYLSFEERLRRVGAPAADQKMRRAGAADQKIRRAGGAEKEQEEEQEEDESVKRIRELLSYCKPRPGKDPNQYYRDYDALCDNEYFQKAHTFTPNFILILDEILEDLEYSHDGLILPEGRTKRLPWARRVLFHVDGQTHVIRAIDCTPLAHQSLFYLGALFQWDLSFVGNRVLQLLSDYLLQSIKELPREDKREEGDLFFLISHASEGKPQ